MLRKWITLTAMAAASATLACMSIVPASADEHDNNGSAHRQSNNGRYNDTVSGSRTHWNQNGSQTSYSRSRRTRRHRARSQWASGQSGYSSTNRMNGDHAGYRNDSRNNNSTNYHHNGSDHRNDTGSTHRDQNGQRTQRDHNSDQH